MAISLIPEEPNGGISLQPKIAETQDPLTVEVTAERADYAMGPDSPGVDQLIQNLHLGAESQIREEASLNQAVKARQEKVKFIQQVAFKAAAEGRPITAEEEEQIKQADTAQISPSVVLEQLYANRFLNELEDYPEYGTFQEAFAEAPEKAQSVRNAAQDFMTKQQIAQKVLLETKQRLDNNMWLNTAGEFALGLVPFYSWSQQHNALSEEGSFLLGANVSAQMRSLYLLPPEEFEARLREAVTSQENTLEALTLASNALTYTSSQGIWDDVFTGLDAVDVATVGVGAAVGTASALSRYAKRVGSAVAANAHPNMGAPARMVTQGNIQGASQNAALARVNNVLPSNMKPTSPNVAVGNTRPQQQLADLLRSTPSMLDPKSYTRDPGSLSVERTNRLTAALNQQADLLYSTMTDVTHLTRISDDAAQVAFKRAEQSFRRIYSKLEDAIIDVRPVRESAEVFGGVDYIKVVLGKKDASGFSKPSQAQFHAKNMYRLPEGSYKIENESGNYFITLTKNVDETDFQVSDLRIQTENAAPETFMNTWLGWLRTPDDTISPRHSSLRKTATYGGNAVMNRLHESAKALGSLGKNERERLRTIMDEARFKWRQVIDTNGQPKRVQGYFYKNIGEFETAYQARHGSLPSDKETQAYFEFRQIMDWDYYQRNLGMLRDKQRLGAEQFSVGFSQVDASGKLQYKMTPDFEGRLVDSLPPASEAPYSVAWYDGKTGKVDFGLSNKLFPSQRKKLQELLDNGNYKIIQPLDPRDDVLGKLMRAPNKALGGGEPIQFLVVRDIKQKPLNSLQIPHNEGGHWNYPQKGFYLKQPKTHRTRFGRRVYDGDITAQYFPSGAQGKKFEDAYETARRYLKDNDPRYKQFVEDNLPYTGDEFARQFRGAKGAPDDAPFDLDAPFVLTQNGQGVKAVRRFETMFSDEVFDVSDSPYTLTNKVNTEYAQQRNERLLTIDNAGTEANPVYKLDTAPLMDPLEALARNASQMARSRFFEDYKHASIEDWVTQFADTLDVPVASVRADPLRYLKEPVFKKDFKDAAKLAAAKNTRRSILQLLNADSEEVKAWKWTRQKIVDGIYKAKGSKGVQVVDPIMWDAKTDPTTIIRSLPFHAYLGFFNPVQLFLQSSATTMAMAIDGNPIRAAQSVLSYWGLRSRGLASTNPRAQGKITTAVAEALGVKADVLDEMYDAWQRSGMNHIEGEYAKIDDYLNPRMFYGQSGVAKAADAGLVFFKEGNNVHRGTSFALSFLRWKQANPKKALTNDALRGIIERADLYYLNMTRASNASWQNGASLTQRMLSVPAQFFAFQVRLSELMLGKRLTLAEKSRLVLMNSALWGVPAGTAGAALGWAWPFAESTRQYAMENNIPIEEGLPQLLMEGVVSTSLQSLTGQNFDIEGRFGPGGLSWLKDIKDGELFELLGAGPNFLTEAYKTMSPFGMAMVGVFSEGSDYPLTLEDFVDAGRMISSANNMTKAMQVWNSGMWMTKDDGLIYEQPSGDPVATLAAAMGLSPQEVTDTYLKLELNKARQETQQTIIREALIQFERGIKAAASGDKELNLLFFRKAHALMKGADLTPLQSAEVFRRAMKENEALIDTVNEDFMMDDPEARLQNYLTYQNANQPGGF
jgi:hypothetical protein